MGKNIIQQRLSLIEKILNEVKSKEEFLFLLGEKEALMPFRYILDIKKTDYQSHWLGTNKYCLKGGIQWLNESF
jgi:hypothetical protein